MASFLPEPDARHMRAERGVRDDTAASAIGAISNIMGVVSQSTAKAREEQRVQESTQAIGSASEGLLSLQDERSNLLLQEQEVTRSIAGIHADDVVTEEEQESLNMLQSQMNTINSARKTGVLNAQAYSLRKNALHKQALADVAHLNIQSNINALFGSNLGSSGPAIDPVNAQMDASLDAQYGVGGWGVAEKGKLIGHQQYVQQKMTEAAGTVEALDGYISNISTSINSNSLGSLLKSIRTNGSATPVAVESYQQNVIATFNNMEAEFERTVAEARANGQPLDKDTLTKMRNDMAAERKYYTTDIWEQDLANTKTLDRIEKSIKIRESLVKANAPMAALQALSLSSGGVGGGGGQDALLAIIQHPNLEALIPEGSPVSAQQMKDSALAAITYSLTADYSIEKQIEDGLINPQLGFFIANATLTKGDPLESPEASHAFVQQVKDAAVGNALTNSSDFIESVNAFSKHANKIGTQGNSDAKEAAKLVLAGQLERVVNETRGSDLRITLDDNGIPVLDVARAAGGIAGGTQRARMTAEQKMVNSLIESYREYARVGVVDMADLQELVQEPEAAPSPKPASATTPLARALRSAQQPEQSGGAGQGPLIEPEGTLLQDEEGNKFRVVGGKYVREQ